MHELVLQALLFLLGLDNTAIEVGNFINCLLDMISDVLTFLISSDLFLILISIGEGLLVIYFMLDLLSLSTKEILSFEKLVVGFIRLFVAAAFILFAPDLTKTLADFGSAFYEDVSTIMETEDSYEVVIVGAVQTLGYNNPFAVQFPNAENPLVVGQFDFYPEKDYTTDMLATGADTSGRYDYSALDDVVVQLNWNGQAITKFNSQYIWYGNICYLEGSEEKMAQLGTIPSFYDVHPMSIENLLSDGDVFGDDIIDYLANFNIVVFSILIYIIQLAIRLACYVVALNITFQLLLYGTLLPIGVSHLMVDGDKSKGLRYCKKYVSKCISFAVIIVCIYVFIKLRQELVLSIYTGADGLASKVRGLYASEIEEGKTRVLYCINGTNKSIRHMGYLRSLFQTDYVVMSALPSFGFFASIIAVSKISDDILGVK